MESTVAIAAFVFLYVIILLFLIFSCIYTFSLLVSAFYKVPFVASRRRFLREIFEFIQPKEGQVFFDLGSGNGRVVFEAADTYKLEAYGYELNPMLILYSNFLRKLKKSTASFIQGNMYDAPVQKADIIYCFLFPTMFDTLADKFIKDCRKGTIIISHAFPIPKLSKNLFKTLPGKPFPTYFYRL